MRQPYWIPFVALWGAVLVYWIVSAILAKRNVRAARGSLLVRFLFVAAFIAVYHFVPGFRRLLRARVPGAAPEIVGLIGCALGLALAVWARATIGRNWGMPMSVKRDPELVVRGPYRVIRHPIYSGILLALLASALVGGVAWLLIFVFWGAYFVFAARAEERLMLRQFPDGYAEYIARTKALIPFVY